ncbi:MAG: cytochrome c [Planctomycetota bacterium]
MFGLALVACAAPTKNSEPTHPPVAHTGEAPSLPTLSAEKPKDLNGLHNIVAYADRVFSGAVPEGEEGFATLQALGVRTVVSVDGATPEVDAAARRGIRYIHLPISYDAVPELRALQLAQVIANTDGPLYMHCHHGKHRSAAAVAAASVLAGCAEPEVAQSRMKVSGTATAYTGLWSSVRNARALDADALKADLSAFPAVATVSGMVATMAELDLVLDLVKIGKENQWQAPSFHPDLVAQKETRRMRDLFASLKTDRDSQKLDAAYQKLLDRTIDETGKLDAAVRDGDLAAANTWFDAVGKSCKECHKTYRDQ